MALGSFNLHPSRQGTWVRAPGSGFEGFRVLGFGVPGVDVADPLCSGGGGFRSFACLGMAVWGRRVHEWACEASKF